MRDPNRPRGNPLFDELDARNVGDSPEDAAREVEAESGETSGANDHTFRDEHHTGGSDTTDAEAGARALVEALMAAGPETADHLLRAMEELLLAARTVMVAAEKGIIEQRAAGRRPQGGSAGEPGDEQSAPPDGGSAHSGFSSIDLD